MKIKLAIVEKNTSYLGRLASTFTERYSDKFEIYSFTDLQVAIDTVSTTRIDVLLVSDAFDFDSSSIKGKCGMAYLVDSPDINTLNNQKTICRFQKVDLIYKQILNIYAESAANITGVSLGEGDCRLIAFASPCGGTGTSSMAAAAAMHFAAKGKRTLYINLEKFGTPDYFFTGEGQFGMSDVIYAVKSKKANLAMKLESCVRTDISGVSFFSQADVALHMIEFTPEEMTTVIKELKNSGSYDYIIVDVDFSIEKDRLKMLDIMHAIVMVGDGSETSNAKIIRAYSTLVKSVKTDEDRARVDKLSLIYNKFSNKTSSSIENLGIANIGGAPKYEHATTKEVLSQLANMSAFDEIIK